MNLESRVTRKLLWRLGPFIVLLYLFFALDRGNIGFAALQMRAALALNAETFGFGSALFTAAYLLLQIPSAAWLRHMGGGLAFAIVACSWGAVSAATAFVPDVHLFLINRFLLGATEAGFTAFALYYINQLFPPRVRGLAIGMMLVAVPTAMVISSPISGALLNWKALSMQGWQWMFVIEGLPSIVLGIACLKTFPRRVSEMKFLSLNERKWLEEQLDAAGELRDRPGLARDTASSLKRVDVWSLGFLLFTNLFAVNVMLVWMPQMIAQVTHAGNVQVGIVNMVPWIALGIGCLGVGFASDRLSSRTAALVPSIAVGALGFLISAVLQTEHPYLAFCAFSLGALGTGAAQGVFWTLAMELLPRSVAANGFAVIGVLGNGSGLIAHPLIGKLHDTTGSFSSVAWCLTLLNLASIVVAKLLTRPTSKPSPGTNRPTSVLNT